MSKQKIAFIDHPFHKKTGSANFFLDLLENEFDVHLFYVEPDPRAVMQEIADAGYELVICWQTEYCAPYLLLRGLRVVCVPMYDGVGNVPDWYWLPMRQAHFINFTEHLHNKLRGLGIDSLHMRYFSAPKSDTPLSEFTELRALFWQRRPEEGLNYRFVRKLLGNVVESIHIHNAPDYAASTDWEPDPSCTVSHFDDDGSAYRAALQSANVYLCPRRTEGIGHTIVEAMACGMCVIGHDAPTANEYIIDGYNGMLVDYDDPMPFSHIRRSKHNTRYFLDLVTAEKLGKNARESYLKGRAQWEERAAKIPFFVSTTPKPDLSRREKELADSYLAICKFARKDFNRYLHLLLRLQNKGLRGQEASTIRLREEITFFAKRIPGVILAWRILRRVRRLTSG